MKINNRRVVSNLATSNVSNLNNSKFFQAPVKRVDLSCLIYNIDIRHFRDFLNGIFRLYSFNMSSANLVHTLVHLINLFVAVNLMHSSGFVDKLVATGKDLYIPQFLHPIITKIISRVNSKSNNGSWVHGELHRRESIQELILSFTTLSHEGLVDVLSNTPFSRVAHDNRLRSQFFSDLNSLLNVANDDLEDVILEHLALIPECVNPKGNVMNMFEGRLESNTSTALGVFRYRNYGDDVYLVNGASCSSVSLNTLDFFACFLKIFQPVFSFRDNSSLPGVFLSGDMLFSVTELDRLDAWECYLSYSIEPVQVKRISKIRKGKTPIPTQPDVDSGIESEGRTDTLTTPTPAGMVSRMASAEPVYYVSAVASSGRNYYYFIDIDANEYIA